VQERTRNALDLIGRANDFLNKTQIAEQLRERIDKWDYKKLKSFYTAKKKVSKLPRGFPQSGRKYLPAIHLTRD
jgi:hypothetical protein